MTFRQNEKELVDQIIALREQLHATREELQEIKGSRVFGKIIRLRDHVGRVRNVIIDSKNLPRKTVHKVRVVVAPYVRPATRKKFKSIYRHSKRALGSITGVNHVIVSTVSLAAWPKKAPLVSVVVPYFNASATIDETIDSLKNQTFIDLEIIIVNDGSTDELSIKKFASLKNDNPDIKFETQINQGPAAARNAGVALAKGKYVICLDSDDWFEPTYVEKVILILETNPDIAVVSSYTETFGVKKSLVEPLPYNPLLLFSNNMLIHAAVFRKEAWQASGGYKSDLGYEDWEYWITLAEKGYWGKVLEEPLFHYRVATESRYVTDKDAHWRNLKKIKDLHTNYKKIIKKLQSQKRNKKTLVEPNTAFVNLKNNNQYKAPHKDKTKILITIPWMTFGGAETLIYNYCREIKNNFNITFITGLKSKHEWEYKFKNITSNIYHLANMFEDSRLYLEFISNYIKTREIDILHIIHNGFMFDLLPEIKKRNPNLKIIVTMFNDRVEYFEQSIGYEEYIDSYVTDNELVARHYMSSLATNKSVKVIPNGINCYKEFNAEMFDGSAVRKSLELGEKDLSVFYVGRLSEEKNPDVFLAAASELLKSSKNTRLKFYMIGDGPMRPAVDKLLNEINSDKIKYLGYQSEIAKYLSAADIFVLPSSIEGFPLSILEAMAMKVAVIASDVGAVSQVITDGEDGFVVEPGSVEEITRAISMLTSDSSLLQSVKQKARLKVESKYSNKILGENYKKLYTDVAK